MQNKTPSAAERREYREYLKENARIVSAWPDWMKNGAYSNRDSAVQEEVDTNPVKNGARRSAAAGSD